MSAKYKNIPAFPKEVRDEILTYTDDKESKVMVNCFDSPTTTKILAGGKGTGKSFAFPCEAVYQLINNPNYNCVIARNLTKDIKRTIKKTLLRFLTFLAFKYGISYLKYFDVFDDRAVFKPTKQEIIFANFQQPNSFAGFDTGNYSFTIYDVFLDEVMQRRTDFSGLTDKEITEFYEEQKENFNYIKQSTILRHAKKDGDNQPRRVFMSMNLWEEDHWVIHDYFNNLMPLGFQNYEALERQHYIFKEDLKKDVSILRLSKFYVPNEDIDDNQKEYYKKLKLENPNLYAVTVLGEAYKEGTNNLVTPFKDYIFDESGSFINDLFFNPKDINNQDLILVIDGWDPGLRDMNGFCRIGITKDYEILVLYVEEIDTKQFANFRRLSTTKFILGKINYLNEIFNFKNSILAIDSKEDTIMEVALKEIIDNGWNVNLMKAVKNKNRDFQIDFSILNRMKFIKQCLEKGIIKFAPQTAKLLEYLAKIVIKKDEDYKRDEKINTEIYDLINAFEYALSVIYHQVIMLNRNEIKKNGNQQTFRSS